MENSVIDEQKKRTFYWRFICLILASFGLSYGFYYVSKLFGEYGLFVSGAVVGAIWGEVWTMWVHEKPGKKWYNNSRVFYIIIIILLGLLIAFLVIRYPLKFN